MAENTKIEWADHTFSGERLVRRPERQPVGVNEPVAALAKRNSVANVKAQVGMVGKAADVMSVQVPALIVAAVATCEAVSQVNVIAPALESSARSKSPALYALPIYIARRVLAARRIRSRGRADLCARFSGVLRPKAGAGLPLSGGAHLCPTFVGHALALHRRNERGLPLQPSLSDNLTTGKGCVSHGR